MISQTIEYSLRAVVFLAFHHGQSITVQHVSERARIPAPYLSKLMQGLVRGGLVRSQRGVGGGFALTREPSEITAWDVVQAVDPIKRIESCPLGIEGHSGKLCLLHHRLDKCSLPLSRPFERRHWTSCLVNAPAEVRCVMKRT